MYVKPAAFSARVATKDRLDSSFSYFLTSLKVKQNYYDFCFNKLAADIILPKNKGKK